MTNKPRSGLSTRKVRCCECGAEFEANSDNQIFCSTPCRNAYLNRRNRRGSLLYDIFMELRYRRHGAKGLWSVMCRLAEEWREEDKATRQDLQSWRDPREYIEKRPYLYAKRGRI